MSYFVQPKYNYQAGADPGFAKGEGTVASNESRTSNSVPGQSPWWEAP